MAGAYDGIGAIGTMRFAGKGLRAAGTALLDLVAPQTCIYCDQPTDAPEAICSVCFAEFERNAAACPRCALPDVGGWTCPECLQHRWALDRIIAPYVYDPAIAYLLRRWKYEKQRYCAEIAVKMLLNNPIEAEKDAIFLATPLHWWRQLQRGFNQSDDLLTSICRRMAPAPAGSAGRQPIRLRRARATAKQSLASRAARRANLEKAFRVSGAVAGRSVVLVDDVCTTGATGEAMAGVLKESGAASVTLWCLARTPRPG